MDVKSVSAALVALGVSLAASAAGPRASLRYLVVGAPSCPDETAVRRAVAARLGYDPFQSDGDLAITVTVRSGERGLEALIELRDRDGASGTRRMEARGGGCEPLVAAVVLTLALAIDPLRTVEGEQPAPPPPVTPPPPPPVPPPAPPPLRRVEARFSVGGLAAFGAAPAITGGFTLQVGLRRDWWSLAVEGRGDVPAAAEATVGGQRGVARSSLVAAALVPCAHWRTFAGCALVVAGADVASGDGFTTNHRVAVPFVAAGARAALEVALPSRLFLRLHADLLVPITRTTLTVDGAAIYTAFPVSGAAGLALGASL